MKRDLRIHKPVEEPRVCAREHPLIMYMEGSCPLCSVGAILRCYAVALTIVIAEREGKTLVIENPEDAISKEGMDRHIIVKSNNQAEDPLGEKGFTVELIEEPAEGKPENGNDNLTMEDVTGAPYREGGLLGDDDDDEEE